MAFVCPLYMDSPSQIYRDLTGREEEKNPIKKLYNRLFRADVGRWISACAVVALSAGVISQQPGPKMLASAAYNLAIAMPVSPQGMLNPRPPTWYMIFLVISIFKWMSAFIVMFVIRVSENPDDVYRLEKRRAGDGFTIADTGPLGILESMTIACGCFGVISLLFCFYQCYVVHQLFTTGYKKSEMREGYRKIKKLKDLKGDNIAITA
ncbi:hypothetical protein EDB81DRAFT_910227 [Dactylonectria macrodidyma]|uniref:Uncharacterized protein n=1 Tax=Dactylonectria macrodidyma TaxID=307937 RepID=A0A9P9FTF0_9HYPO|nr:hypothetical protein EDB81DRAFT_910227 [Dactylonectria macrodidyma]